MKIENIKKEKNKYKITLENKDTITTYDEVIIKTNILYKKEINENLLKQIEQENQYYDAYNKAIKYIKTKLRSEQEIRTYLEKEINIEQIDQIIKKLKELNLINDKIFTKAYIHDKLNFTNDGKNKIKKSLQSHYIDDNIIEEELNNIDNNTYIEKLTKQIKSKINKNNKYSDNILKQKLLIHFINLGYEKEEILKILENNNKTNPDIIKKEYEKINNKLKTKYKEEELKYMIKNKLYQKGFKIEEINEILKDK